MKLFSLEGDVAFVTGAGSGIGQAIAVGMAEAGAEVALFDFNAAGLDETFELVKAHGRRCLVVEGSVTDEGQLANAVEACARELGGLTIAVNSAGIANAMPAEEMPRERWQQMLDVNLTGVFLSCQAEARVMLPRKRGSIVNIASMSGSIVNRGLSQAHYNASKAGVIHLSKSLAMEWVASNIRVNAISPGYTLSPMNRRAEVADQLKVFERETPMARIASVDEMVGPAVFLASAAASFVTGHDLVVDGGFTNW